MLANLAHLTTNLNRDSLPIAAGPAEIDAADLDFFPEFSFFIQLPEHRQVVESILVDSSPLETTPEELQLLIPIRLSANGGLTAPARGQPEVAGHQIAFAIDSQSNPDAAPTQAAVTNHADASFARSSEDADRSTIVSTVRQGTSSQSEIGRSIARQAVESVQSELVTVQQRSRHSITVDINPPELGRMNIQVDVSADRVSAHIVVSEWLSAELLTREKDTLIQALNGFGFGNASVDISHGSLKRDGHAESESWQDTADDVIEETTEAIRVSSGKNLNGLNLVA